MSDYISREADGDDFVRRADIVEKFMDRLPSISVGYLCKVADEIPAADVRPVKVGHWIIHKSDLFPADSTIECDQCHAEQPIWIDDNFCPNCGAKMGGAP